MADGLRSIHIVTQDEVLLSSARAAAGGLEGWTLRELENIEDLLQSPPSLGDVILLDGWMSSAEENVYEACRRLTGETRCRTFVIPQVAAKLAEPIAIFCGATGVIPRPLSSSSIREAIDRASGPRPPLASDRRESGAEADLPETLLRDLVGESRSDSFIQALTDPETSLFSYEFLTFKLDEEFKRAKRFGYPLSCVMLGFEGQANEEVLGELASIFLQYSRDTDILGRFDESSFLFLLPHTGPDGAGVMAKRIGEKVDEEELQDLVGDHIQIAVGIASTPHPGVVLREELFKRAKEAYLEAQREGGGVVSV